MSRRSRAGRSIRDACLLRREADGTLVTHAELGARVGGYPSDMVVDFAIPRPLDRLGLSIDDIDLWEHNEALWSDGLLP
jgi:acetyl-CoA acetyltransferase